MSDLSTVTAAPIEIELGSKTYKMRPLTIADLGDFENWVRQKIIANSMHAARDLPARDRRDLTSEAINAASRVTYDSREAQGMMQSIEGAGQLIYLSLRHEHPDITREQVVSKLANVQQFSNLADSLMKISAPNLNGGESPKAEPVKPAITQTSPSSL
ncbi:MAG TPA: hypothetical protein DCM28_05175 [Phycisphaerales bacterium]|nr:hypothetical protein [Phycisphaerales bacterium]HCD32289.1 hypothetical protein [Phycisphaerales bacterium]|tara:strand:+ start:851 stop:1324 length:474 start_codon:yes stop_codon:yes gene_type:complete